MVKLGLGSVSMFFDILFMIQHFILYPNHEEEPPSDKGDLLVEVEKSDEFVRTPSNRLLHISSIKTP